MNIVTALFRENGALNSSRAGSAGNGSASGRKGWFTSEASDQDVRDVVAQCFRSMTVAHDRIRTEVLTSRDGGEPIDSPISSESLPTIRLV
jgi:hypothetical protein